MSPVATAEQEPPKKDFSVGLTDRIVHFAFTRIWINDLKTLSSAMGLAGLSLRGTNIMVDAYIPPELLEMEPNLVK